MLHRKLRFLSLALIASFCTVSAFSDMGIFRVPSAAPKKAEAVEQPKVEDDSLHFPIRPTSYRGEEKKMSTTGDLKDPENLKRGIIYDEKSHTYLYGVKLGNQWITTPFQLTEKEVGNMETKQSMYDYFRKKNAELALQKAKDKFDFTDMHFDLGPASRIFGPGGVRITTQGAVELKLGGTTRKIDDPSLSERNRKVFGFDFGEKVNLNVSGKIGDKMSLDFNYNSDATFSFDAQKLKLRYEGKEDEIIKLIEAGNVSIPTNNSLIHGSSSLFGLRTDFQFGKLKLSTVLAQKKSASQTVKANGGVQMQNFAFRADDYDENRHFFLAHFFRDNYDNNMSQLPNILSGVTIKRVEIWVTNNTGQTTNTRNIVGFTDLGEHNNISNRLWSPMAVVNPSNNSNSLYNTLIQQLSAARNISMTTQTLDGYGLKGGKDYEKLESARLLSSSEYHVNNALGYISLRSTLQTDQVLAVAFEYTYRGKDYQVGEFSTDVTNPSDALFVKSLKNTANTPRQGNWDLMMKNVYSLGASNVQKENFRLNIKYLSDTAGVQINYLPISGYKDRPIIQLIGLDRLDNNNRRHPNGYYDFIDGYTINPQDGRVFFNTVEPFGKYLRKVIGNDAIADKFVYQALYDSTKTVAKQMAEQNKFFISGQYKASREDEISLGTYNVPRGSVVVTAGGVRLIEGSDYSVDYYGGVVKILNRSLLDANTPINVSLESNTDYGMQRKTLFGVNWQYDFSKQFNFGGTFMHLGEKPLTTKIAMGSETLNNTLWGLNLSYRTESQWLTNLLDKLPFVNATEPSSLSFNAEFAQLMAGTPKGTQGNASYLDDFENASGNIDISDPRAWNISSTPSTFPESQFSNDLRYGYNRALLAWYYIDPIFTRRSSSLTPGHIKGDLEQLSDPDVREIYKTDLFPNKSINTQESMTMNVLNLAYYPNERGPYNLDTDVNQEGYLNHPTKRWGGMMRSLSTTDFEASNVEYIEFWMMDPFIKAKKTGKTFSGNLYFNLGEISEDVLKDGKKFYESGLPPDADPALYTETIWGRVPNQMSVTYAFSTAAGAREKQDVGFNGLSSEDEAKYPAYKNFLEQIQAKVSPEAYAKFLASPSGDKYHYYRGSDYDAEKKSILDRYKYINNPNGNSLDAGSSRERYSTAYKNTPDVEDINLDYTLNEYERYYQYHVHISPDAMEVGRNYIVDTHETTQKLRNGKRETYTWYLFRIPVKNFEKNVGGISGFNSIRFMRMFMTDFDSPVVLRMATLHLVRGDWRTYEQRLYNNVSEGTGTLEAGVVNFEENNEKKPVNYVLPPGITRVLEPGNKDMLQNNEQALSLVVKNLSSGTAKAVYKNMNLDLRRYRHLQMFNHANSLIGYKAVKDDEVSVFIRLGTDYQNNFYEYELPLKITPPGLYPNNQSGSKAVWPLSNLIDIDLSVFTHLKRNRNRQKVLGNASYNSLYSEYDNEKPGNKISVMGNPSLGDIRTIMIGVRNNSREVQNVEVWTNELRLQDMTNKGGWAAQATLNLKLSDVATFDFTGHMETYGFGGIEETVMQRRDNTLQEYNMSTNVQLGKFLPEKVKLNAPLYYSYSKEKSIPQYNPLDSDMPIEDAYASLISKQEKDSLRNIANRVVINKNFALSGVRFNIITTRHPMPYDPGNFTFSYAHSMKHTTGETTAWEKNMAWKWNMNYNYSPNYEGFSPFRRFVHTRSKWGKFFKEATLNYLPQNVTFNSDLGRNYYEMQERDMENLNNHTIPLIWSSDFLWNRSFAMRWDLTKNIRTTFSSGTNAEILQPYTAVNKDLYPDRYQAWKDSVWQSIKSFGTPLNYAQSFELSWRPPIQFLPIFSWISSDITYRSSYSWARGTSLDNGLAMGNAIAMGRETTGNTRINLEKLYNFVPFLKKVNQQFSNSNYRKPIKSVIKKYQKEIQLKPDTTVSVVHNQQTKHPRVTALRPDGKVMRLRYKVVNRNKIVIETKDTTLIKLTITAPKRAEDQKWYKVMQYTARGLMMVRNISINYSNKFNMNVPGFLPNIGDFFGQGSGLQPGLDFAFGWADENYLDKAVERGWLMRSDSIITPATVSKIQDLQIRASLEPMRDLKIDLTATRNSSLSRSIQYMFEGMPTTETGSFLQTTISFASAFEKLGNADVGYRSRSFEKFRALLPKIKAAIETRYVGTTYPQGTNLAGQKFSAENGGVNPYSADVMIPAFLSAYTGSGDGLHIFPSLWKMLPNWNISYSGLNRLKGMGNIFKNFTLRHGYKSIFSIGSYSTFTSYLQTMSGLGYIRSVSTGYPVPSSMFDVSTVSVNESFSPLIGVDMTFINDINTRLEMRKTRVLTLSMTNQQINEARSNDFVLGLGYRISDFKWFSNKNGLKTSNKDKRKGNTAGRNKSYGNDGSYPKSLNVRFDFTLRNQTAVNRDILTGLSQATGGNKAVQVSFSAEYALSRLITLTAYYDRQMNKPLLTSTSYPTTTQDFGISMRIKLNH